MKKLLLVDDEEFFLEGLKEGLDKYSEIFETTTALSVDVAIKKIKKKKFDLIISDMRMPKKSGLDLFLFLRKKKFKGGFKVMTAYGTDELLSEIKKSGGIEIFLKPFKLDWFAKQILSFFSIEIDHLEKKSSDDLESLAELINLDKKSVKVDVVSSEGEGSLDFIDGELWHAFLNDTEGEKAALDIFNSEITNVSIKNIKTSPDRTIKGSLSEIVKNKETNNTNKEEVNKLIDLDKIEKKKEITMNIDKLNESIEVLKKDLRDGLMATDIFDSKDGQSIAGWNGQPAACALFNNITNYMKDALDGAGFPGLGKYYLLDLVDDKLIIVITMGDFQWGLLVDRTKTQLGLLLNVVIPKITDSFEEAIAS